jgi:hypothetical protein
MQAVHIPPNRTPVQVNMIDTEGPEGEMSLTDIGKKMIVMISNDAKGADDGVKREREKTKQIGTDDVNGDDDERRDQGGVEREAITMIYMTKKGSEAILTMTTRKRTHSLFLLHTMRNLEHLKTKSPVPRGYPRPTNQPMKKQLNPHPRDT